MSLSDQKIVRAAIYPAIGIARVGNSPDGYFIGPEVITPTPRPVGFYKDPQGRLKRQAARFRIYGLNAAGEVVRELNASNAKIKWQAHVANKKAAWYAFNVALDIPQATPVPLRNANITGKSRMQLTIDPGPVKITGTNQTGSRYQFDKGTFFGEPVYLGELRTDELGRLIFLGGHGVSKTPFPHNPPTTFANNDGWHDDTSDGPVEAEVVYEGAALEVEGAWVVCAPPNYAPDVISVQTLYDVIYDTLQSAYIPPRLKPSFAQDILPLLQQFSHNQWVNQGFYVGFGYGQPYDFTNPELIRKLGTLTTDAQGNVTDDFREYRRQIFNYFRPPYHPSANQAMEPELWPWMYGDNMNLPPTTPNAYLSVTNTLYTYLQQWAAGNFEADWEPEAKQPESLEDLWDPQAQADMLTKAALWYCLGGAFHPGCEMTWPMRLATMYSGPFRIRRRSPNNPEPDYGPTLDPLVFTNPTTPIGVGWNSAGDLTRWMAVPWQTDTASCRAGYESQYDPLIPTFWPARVPNTVLAEEDYAIVMDEEKTLEERLDAFNRRASWPRILGANYLNQIASMIEHYGDLGVVEAREGVPDSPYFPPVIYVESVPFGPGASDAPKGKGKRAKAKAETPDPERLAQQAAAAKIPRKQGLYVGPVGKGAPRR